jgi:hypothetical protein
MSLAIFTFLILELRVSGAKLVVGYVGIYTILIDVMHIRFIREAGIGCNDGFVSTLEDVLVDTESLIAFFNGFGNRQQGMVLLAFAKGLCVNDNLVFPVYRCQSVITLDGAFAGGHLGAFVIGDITLHFLWSFAFPDPWAVGL